MIHRINSDHFPQQDLANYLSNGEALHFFEVGTHFLNIIQINFVLQSVKKLLYIR
jgi:hypothetical protein